MNYDRLEYARKILLLFCMCCVVLYLCHASYFMGVESKVIETLWKWCNLTVFPLYYIYLCRLTSEGVPKYQVLLLLAPGIAIVLLCLMSCDGMIDTLRKIIFALQVLFVEFQGFVKLKRFDLQIFNFYADTEGRSTKSIRVILVLFLVTSVFAFIINFVGKAFFANDVMMLALPSLAFSCMLFALFYVGYHHTFTYEQFALDAVDDSNNIQTEEQHEYFGKIQELGAVINHMINDEQMFLQKNLRVGDVAKACCTNRSYVSRYINDEYGCTFSDHICKKRIEYAQMLMKTTNFTKISQIAEKSGFSNEQSFYRSFKKITNASPMEWLELKR